ncbi:hypothetical protein R3P38DRAFT_3194803 [Favolaschia claudopus]|uniref:Nucleoplasmin-like domain-containing protein n=1 Tax=Favolaschia claudopus TaxID=2862362 RepID=A0AAW0BDD1_9AGAR
MTAYLWTLSLTPGEVVVPVSSRPFKITAATLKSIISRERSVVTMSLENNSRSGAVLCSLIPGCIERCLLDFPVSRDACYAFEVKGKNNVCLSGHYCDSDTINSSAPAEALLEVGSASLSYRRPPTLDLPSHVPAAQESTSATFDRFPEASSSRNTEDVPSTHTSLWHNSLSDDDKLLLMKAVADRTCMQLSTNDQQLVHNGFCISLEDMLRLADPQDWVPDSIVDMWSRLLQEQVQDWGIQLVKEWLQRLFLSVRSAIDWQDWRIDASPRNQPYQHRFNECGVYTCFVMHSLCYQDSTDIFDLRQIITPQTMLQFRYILFHQMTKLVKKVE